MLLNIFLKSRISINFRKLLCLVGGNLFLLGVIQGQIALRPDWRVYPIYTEARKSLENNDYKKSIDLLNKAIIEGQNNIPHLVWVYEDLAAVEILYGDSEKSFEYLQKMVSLGFGKTYYQYSFLTRSPQYKYLWQNPKWDLLINDAKNNFIKQIKLDGDAPEVQFLLQEDQADRLFMPPNLYKESFDSPLMLRFSNEMLRRNIERQNKVKMLIKEGKLKSSNDYRSAALVFQHSGDGKDIKFAKELALQGYSLAKDENERCSAGALIAVTTDRLLWYQGKPQIYGTQSRSNSTSFREFVDYVKEINENVKKNGEIPLSVIKKLTVPTNNEMTIDPIDTTKITDEQRKKFCTRTLEQFLKGKVKGR